MGVSITLDGADKRALELFPAGAEADAPVLMTVADVAAIVGAEGKA